MTTDGPGVSLFRYNAIAFFILCAPMARQGDGVEDSGLLVHDMIIMVSYML